MEPFALCFGLVATSGLCVWGAHAAWSRSLRWLPLVALGLVTLGVVVFGAKSQSATGGYFPGLGEFLIAACLLIGPGLGLLLGIILACWRRVGSVLLVLYILMMMVLLVALVGR